MPNTYHNRNTCIIIGASIAGLLAARVLSPYFDSVIIFERDHLSDTPEYRSGTAQAQHAHILLRRGLLGLEKLFPGYTQNLLDAGGVMTNASRDWYNLFPMGAFPNFDSDYEFMCASRSLIEFTLRKLLLQQFRNIVIRDHCLVTNLILTPNQAAVISVQTDNKESAIESLSAELLIDASGRNSHMTSWLQQQGFGLVAESLLKPWLGYATRLYSNVSMPEGVKATVIMAKAPDLTRGGVLFPIENNRYICTLYGFSKDYPATDEAGFLHYASSLRADIIYNALRQAVPSTEAKAFIKNENIYRHYAHGKCWPHGLLVIGDAVCSFNPIYGQGMTSSVLAAEMLGKIFQHGKPENAADYALAQRKIVRVYKNAWTISTNEDLRWPKTEGGKPGLLLRIMHRFTNWIGIAATQDTRIAFVYIKVLHMTKSPLALLAPEILLRLVKAFSRRTSLSNKKI